MWFRNPFAAPTTHREPARRRPTPRLTAEPLEDRCVPATLSVADITVLEGTSGVRNAAVTVALSEPANKPVDADYRTTNGSATAGSDYVAVAGKLTFAKGETVKTVLVPIYGNQVPETTEAFTVRLSNAKGATVADGVGIVTIVDSVPRLSITSSQFGTEGGLMTFTVTLSALLAMPLTVDFATADYTTDPQMLDAAFAGQDYVAASGTLTFAPGETSKTFTVQTLADGLEEYDELFAIWFSNPSTPVFFETNGWQARIPGELGEWI